MIRRERDYRRMINSARWLRLRRDKLEVNPLCESCQSKGVLRSAREVHHRVPVESVREPVRRERLMFDFANLMSLCRECHVEIHRAMRKGTAKENAKRKGDEGRGFIERMLQRKRCDTEEGEAPQGVPRGAFFEEGGTVSKPDPPLF